MHATQRAAWEALDSAQAQDTVRSVRRGKCSEAVVASGQGRASYPEGILMLAAIVTMSLVADDSSLE